MTEYDSIIIFSSIDWDFIWQGHQEIATKLAGQGHQVLFVENTGVRAPTFKDWPRLRQRLWNWRRSVKGFRQAQEHLFIYSPVLPPWPYSRIACWINSLLLRRALRRWMRVMRLHRPLIWTFLPTPLIRRLIDLLEPELTVYYCIDDFVSSSRHAQRIRRSETKLFREADLVFVTSEKLRERACRVSNRVHLFPFGVNFEQFQQVRLQPDEVPSELASLPHPVVGYVGGIHQWVDQELLANVARHLPQASFVLVGPSQTDVSKLSACPNIHFFGTRPHAEIPCYIKGFDVGIIPYRLSDYTAHVYPTKLNEYLAMGVPVVATDLPEIRRFNQEHGSVINIADSASAFAKAIQRARQELPAATERRVEIARSNSWEARIAKMTALIQGALREQCVAPLSWEQTLRQLYRAAQRRLLLPLIGVVAVTLILFQTPLLWWVAAPLRVDQVPQSAEAIVVFAGGVGESGQAMQGYQERVEHAVELYHHGYAPRLLFSSGYVYTFKEPEVMRALAVSLGVPPEAIWLEDRAKNTYENVRYSAALLRAHHLHSALVISSPYHMRRVAMVWRHLAPDIAVRLTPVEKSHFFGAYHAVELKHWRAILHEYLGISYYWLRGWL